MISNNRFNLLTDNRVTSYRYHNNVLHSHQSSNMQKIILLSIFTCLLFSAQGQYHKLKVGLHAGPNMTSIHGHRSLRDFKKYRLDFAFGFDIEIPMGEKLSLKSGLEYEGKGEKISILVSSGSAMPGGTKKTTISYDYLQIPILASYKMSNGNTNLYVDLGPYLGYLLSAKVIDEPFGQYEGGEFNGINRHRPFDFGIMGGLGIAFPLSEKIEGSFAIHDHLGLANIAKPEIANVPIRTHTIGLRMGAMLRI